MSCGLIVTAPATLIAPNRSPSGAAAPTQAASRFTDDVPKSTLPTATFVAASSWPSNEASNTSPPTLNVTLLLPPLDSARGSAIAASTSISSLFHVSAPSIVIG